MGMQIITQKSALMKLLKLLSLCLVHVFAQDYGDMDEWFSPEGEIVVNFEEGYAYGDGICIEVPILQFSICFDYKVSICEAASAYLKVRYGSGCDDKCEDGEVWFEGELSIDEPIKLDEIGDRIGVDIPDNLQIFLTKKTQFLPGYARICPGIQLPEIEGLPSFIMDKINFECVEVGSDCTSLESEDECAMGEYCGWCESSASCLHNFYEYPMCDVCESGFYYHELLVEELEKRETQRIMQEEADEEQKAQKERNTNIAITVTVIVLTVLLLGVMGYCCYKKKKENRLPGYSPSGPGIMGGGQPTILEEEEDQDTANTLTASDYHHPVFVHSHAAAATSE